MALHTNTTQQTITELINDDIQSFSIFKGLSTEAVSDILQKAKLHIKPRYSYVYTPNEKSDNIYFLLKGTVKIGTHSKTGKEVIKSVLYPKVMFGELAVAGEEQREDFARAMNKEITFLSISKEGFQQLLCKHYKLNHNFMMLMGSRLRRVEDRLESLIFKDARTRIVDFIRDAADKRGLRIGYEMLLQHSLTQQDIANITGTSRQTVTSVLNELKKNNLINFTRNSILIRDVASLV